MDHTRGKEWLALAVRQHSDLQGDILIWQLPDLSRVQDFWSSNSVAVFCDRGSRSCGSLVL